MRQLIRLCLALLVLSSPARAGELELASSQLETLLGQLAFVKRNGLHMQDEARIFILEKTVQGVLGAVREKGLGNFFTLNQYQQLIVKFRYSSQFFEFIRTARTEKSIRDMLELVARIREQRGFDDDPYSKILKSNIEQMHSSLQQLARLDETPPDLRGALQRLVPLLGEALALAELGDRPRAFAKAAELYRSVRSLYPALQQLSSSRTAFRHVLEVMGLNEFVGEYSQVER